MVRIFKINDDLVMSPFDEDETIKWYMDEYDLEDYQIPNIEEVNYSKVYREEIEEDERGLYDAVKRENGTLYGYQSYKHLAEKYYNIDIPEIICFVEE